MQNYLDVLFLRLLLEDRQLVKYVDSNDWDFALTKGISLINAEREFREKRSFEIQLRTAAHLCPKEALMYDHMNPQPRWELIRDYLVNSLKYSDNNSTKRLARNVAIILDNWETTRDSVAGQKERLLNLQDGQCAHCHVSFNGKPVTAKLKDDYKPYHPKTEQRLTPEVDHIDPVSGLGTNKINNLQVLCRLCNYGKGDGLGFDVRKEIEYAGKRISDIDWSYRVQMCYQVINAGENKCSRCGTNGVELTIRPVSEDGGYLRSNLRPICINCI